MIPHRDNYKNKLGIKLNEILYTNIYVERLKLNYSASKQQFSFLKKGEIYLRDGNSLHLNTFCNHKNQVGFLKLFSSQGEIRVFISKQCKKNQQKKVAIQ